MSEPAQMFEPLSPDEAKNTEHPQLDDDGLRVVSPVPDNAPPMFPPHRLGKPTNKWVYRDAEGRRLFVVARWDTETGKDVLPLTFCEAVDGSRAWRWKAPPAPRTLYGLDKLSAAPDAPVVVVEGEKAAEAAARLLPDHVVTTSPGGSKAAGKADWSPLRERDVTVWPDADKPGEKYARDAASLVRGAKVISPPDGVKAGWDAADAEEEGWTIEQALALVAAAQAPTDKPTVDDIDIDKLRAVTAREFITMKIPPREMVLAPWLPEQGLAMVFAKRGVGKTHVSLGIAFAVATGGKFLKWEAPKPRRTLFFDGEMPASALQERLAAIAASAESDMPSDDYLRLVTPDLQERPIPDLATPEGQRAIEPLLEGVELLVLDNVSTLCRSVRENEADSWSPVQAWLLELRRRGLTVLIIHHAGKGGTQRGTSKRDDPLDTIVRLEHPQDYSPSEGARFEVHFDKTRGFYGPDADPFDAAFLDNKWSFKSLQASLTGRIARTFKDGTTKQREIADELGISVGAVNKHLKLAREQGLVDG